MTWFYLVTADGREFVNQSGQRCSDRTNQIPMLFVTPDSAHRSQHCADDMTVQIYSGSAAEASI